MELTPETTVEYYPLDYATLVKGQMIHAEHIEKITGAKRGSDRYRLGMLGLKQSIEKETDALGRPMIVREIQSELRILTDAEAAKYLARRRKSHVRGVCRSFKRQAKVDTANLTVDQRKEHETQMLLTGRYVSAMRSARRKVFAVEKYTPPVPLIAKS